MIHPYDAIKDPINSRHPTYKVYKKLYQHKNRYMVGEEIVIICFYHLVNDKKSYNDIDYYIRRCKERTLGSKDIKFEFNTLVVKSKFTCFFEMEGYEGTFLNSIGNKLINKVPHISFYHSSFPKVYFEWKLEYTDKTFIDYTYCKEISKINGNRFKEVFSCLKTYRNIYIESIKRHNVNKQN